MQEKDVSATKFLNALDSIRHSIRDFFVKDNSIASISFENLKIAVLAYPCRLGKGMRPALVNCACGLFNPDLAKVFRIAAAIELTHIWTLVHDDIIDESENRRGHPSVHHLLYRRSMEANECNQNPADIQQQSVSLAILAGDVQQAWANSLLLDAIHDGVPMEIVLAISKRLNHVVIPQLINGEALDVVFEQEPIDQLSDKEMERMLRLKTAVLLRFAAESGAMVGLGTADHQHHQVQRLGALVELAGLAFQLQDDLLDIFGDAAQLGKPLGSDLRNGKRTLLFCLAAQRLQGEEKRFFLQSLGNPDVDESAIHKVSRLLIDSKAVEMVKQRCKQLLDEAHALLQSFPDNQYRSLLAAWINFIVKRRH